MPARSGQRPVFCGVPASIAISWGEMYKMTVSRSCSQARPLAEHVRRFSAIAGLQAAYRVVYALYRLPGGLAVSARCFGARGERRACCALDIDDDARAADLLLFLYENAVPPEHLQAVIQDVSEALSGS